MNASEPSLFATLKKYFNITPNKENEDIIISNIESSISFRGPQLWILIFAIFIASLGLNVNSTAVIIGAMLISPLMGPIIGMGLAVGISDFGLLRRSVTNYVVSTVISVLTATLYFYLTPIDEAQSELLARTAPSLYDVLIALVGGGAGFIALSTRDKGNVIPGVAIATALMPPLCTAGYGLAVGNLSYFLGAFYLFFINTVFICLATFIGTRMLKFKPVHVVDSDRVVRVRRYVFLIVIVTMIPAAYMTMLIIRESIAKNNLRRFVRTELAFRGTQILSQEIDMGDKVVRVVALGKTIPRDAIARADSALARHQLAGYKLHVIQGGQSDSLLLRSTALAGFSGGQESSRQKVIEQSQHLHEMEEMVDGYTRYESAAYQLSGELKTLFPQVEKIILSNVREVETDSARRRRYVMAVVGSGGRWSAADREKLRQWLRVRTQADSLRLIITK